METLNVRIEVPSIGSLDVGELERKLTEYAKKIILTRVAPDPIDDTKDLYISPVIKELETGFVCPENMSHDYKEEITSKNKVSWLPASYSAL